MSPTESESKYKIGKLKRTASVIRNEKTGLSYITLMKRPEQKIYGCTRFNGHYREEKKLGQGTFGEVYKGVHLETQKQVAIKRILVNLEKDLFPITAQREITILRRLDHKNIIKLIEMIYDFPPSNNNGNSNNNSYNSKNQINLPKSFYMILPYMVADLSGVLHNPRISLKICDIKNMMLQLLEGMNYIHCMKYMHRDIKAANILIDHTGILKIADFGLSRVYYGSPPNLKYPGGAGSGAKYTSVVVTRWYRAPELVLGDKYYTTAVDMWGVGCVFAEFFEKKPILQGKTDVDQGHVIFKLVGTPTKDEWPLAKYLPGAELTRTNYPGTIKDRFGKYLSDAGLDFLKQLLRLDPYKRLTAMSAVNHKFFQEAPLPSSKLSLPCEESHEADIKRYKEELHQEMSQRAPTAPEGHITETENNNISKIQSTTPATKTNNILKDTTLPRGPGSKLTPSNQIPTDYKNSGPNPSPLAQSGNHLLTQPAETHHHRYNSNNPNRAHNNRPQPTNYYNKNYNKNSPYMNNYINNNYISGYNTGEMTNSNYNNASLVGNRERYGGQPGSRYSNKESTTHYNSTRYNSNNSGTNKTNDFNNAARKHNTTPQNMNSKRRNSIENTSVMNRNHRNPSKLTLGKHTIGDATRYNQNIRYDSPEFNQSHNPKSNTETLEFSTNVSKQHNNSSRYYSTSQDNSSRYHSHNESQVSGNSKASRYNTKSNDKPLVINTSSATNSVDLNSSNNHHTNHYNSTTAPSTKYTKRADGQVSSTNKLHRDRRSENSPRSAQNGVHDYDDQDNIRDNNLADFY
ncbi:hypothetical protein TBLA_0J00250 [Henningerozyma blattae CBS 6284]|uniref:Serine/threonine-protein kinase BUR1 n=1 Tax=Henningerozyma blattae (strain ATCC 34711 / CBS 6284 / DSM 70876 / NBRC 10599 / NRRL Y-10934 / UCD 77-7) TaxID=1071380 RepID=I2H9H3_HENB6|nr:hypothetical protein TBLA_0J00250 [Tetrapisispora blattae CBS 6284]CCH63025.1 hypothetical protein TBLA_0J00250 [Tetrapisispora blattae CBS 6284]